MNGNSPYAVVEETNLAEVLPQLVQVLDATRDNQPSLQRFEWLYQSNPEGEAVVWTLRKRDTQEIVGFTSCIPRRMRVGKTIGQCWIGADFSILPKYRSLGLALQLRRAARTQIDAGRVGFLYSHPNDRMAVIHEKVGHQKLGTMIRLARLVSVKAVLEERRSTRAFAGMASRLIDPMLHFAGPEWRTSRRLASASEVDLAFNGGFDELFERETTKEMVIGVRDARYLHWRYVENPLHHFRLLTCHAQEKLAGYLIFSLEEADNTLIIHDIFPGSAASQASPLLAALWTIARREGRRSISMTLLGSSPLARILKEFQYSQRPETSQMYVHVPESHPVHKLLIESSSWYVNMGDRDV